MRTASVGAASRAPAAVAVGPAAIGGAGLVLLGWAIFFGGDSRDGPLVLLGTTALVVAGAAVAAAFLLLVPFPDPGAAGIAFFVLLAGLAAWCGASISWSIEPDRSWSYTNRGLAYLGFAAVGLFGGALVPRAPRRLATCLAVLLGLALGWALLGKAIPDLFPDGARVARLRNPVGYWNGLALLADAALPLALWGASRRAHRPAVRLAGVLLLYAAGVALVLTYSRAGVAVGAFAVLAWLALDRERLEGIAALLCAGPLAAAVAGWATTRRGIAENGQAHHVRVLDGAYFGLVAVAGAALVFALASLLLARERARPPTPAQRRLLVRAALGVSALVAGAAIAVLLVRAGGPGPWVRARAHEFTSVQVQPTQGPGRVGSFSSGNRWTWWKEAWRAFRAHPLDGIGAGSFAIFHRHVRGSSLDVATEPHNVPLQFLGETGIVGFLLLAGAVAAAGAGILRARRALPAEDVGPATALAVGALAYLLHALVDFDWDFVAVTGPVVLVVGALLGAAAPPVRARERQPLLAAGALAIVAAAVLSLGSPWLALRRVNEGLDALADGRPAAAISSWREAHSLNPFALEPLLLWANAEAAAANIPEAKRLFQKAVDAQPQSPEAWYQFGIFELDVDHYYRLAYVYLNRSYTLDRFGPATDGSLDRARALVNAAAKRRPPAPGAPPAAPAP